MENKKRWVLGQLIVLKESNAIVYELVKESCNGSIKCQAIGKSEEEVRAKIDVTLARMNKVYSPRI